MVREAYGDRQLKRSHESNRPRHDGYQHLHPVFLVWMLQRNVLVPEEGWCRRS